MRDYLIQAEKIEKNFAGVCALAGVDLSVRRGEIHSLIGENGSGKSTLIKIMAGVLAPDSGLIYIDGEPQRDLNPIQAIRKGIQVIYQDFSLFPNLTVAENLAMNSELAGGSRLIRWKRVRKIAASAVDQLEVRLDLESRVDALSVAQQQLVAISRALVQGARLIIMDEPTAALTYKEVESLYRVIRRLKRRSVSVLFVSHKLEEVFQVSDRISILRGGRVVFENPAAALETSELVYHMTGRRLNHRSGELSPVAQEKSPLLRVENLARRGSYREVSFELGSGEVLGLTGLLGSGQADLALSLFGLLPPDSGTVSVRGVVQDLPDVERALALGIGLVPENRLEQGLFLNQSIEKNLNANRLEQFKAGFRMLDRDAMREAARKWVENLKISIPSLESPVKTLSGGNQQRVVIARWLARSPAVLILHNPTSGVDIASRHDIHGLIRELGARGTGVLIISDDLSELLATCNRILVMKKGTLSAALTTQDLTEEELMEKVMA